MTFHRFGLGVAVVALTMAASSAVSAQDGGWFERWMGRDTTQVASRSAAETREARNRENARLDAYLENDQPLLGQATVEGMQAAIERYRRIVAAGGWPQLPRTKGAWLRPGARDQRVPLLKRRLAISGDLRGRVTNSTYFDDKLAAALKRFQVRHGLRPNGVVDLRTLSALNVPADDRLATLQINALRVRTFHDRLREASRYVVVNVPSFDLQAVRGETVELYSKVIAGRATTQTPTVETKIRALNFFPYWRVPNSIARRDLIPTIQKDPEYLEREGIRVLTDWGGEELDPRYIDWTSERASNVKFRQDPGERNALGLVRIDMPNEHIVYLHDTPMKPLFGRSTRNFSAGCVRVERVMELATWLANEDGTWEQSRVDSILAAAEQTDVKLNEHVPVLFVYLTAWADGTGGAHFRPDVYSRDGLNNAVVANYDDEDDVPVTLSP